LSEHPSDRPDGLSGTGPVGPGRRPGRRPRSVFIRVRPWLSPRPPDPAGPDPGGRPARTRPGRLGSWSVSIRGSRHRAPDRPSSTREAAAAGAAGPGAHKG